MKSYCPPCLTTFLCTLFIALPAAVVLGLYLNSVEMCIIAPSKENYHITDNEVFVGFVKMYVISLDLDKKNVDINDDPNMEGVREVNDGEGMWSDTYSNRHYQSLCSTSQAIWVSYSSFHSSGKNVTQVSISPNSAMIFGIIFFSLYGITIIIECLVFFINYGKNKDNSIASHTTTDSSGPIIINNNRRKTSVAILSTAPNTDTKDLDPVSYDRRETTIEIPRTNWSAARSDMQTSATIGFGMMAGGNEIGAAMAFNCATQEAQAIGSSLAGIYRI